MRDEYNITYCKLRGQAASVDTQAEGFKTRMAEINKICGEYHFDDIYNCDETGFYLTDMSCLSLTTQNMVSGVKPKRSARVSILFCVNASGSSLSKSQKITALRPLVLSKHIST